MAKLILQAVLFVTLISALYGAPQNPTTPRNAAAPAIATLEAKLPNEKNAEHPSSEEDSKIRPARTPDHDGTNHDHKDEHHHGAAKLDEHVDHGSSTTPKNRPARAAEGDEKKHEESHEHHQSGTLKKEEEHKHDATTSTKPRTARAAEEKKHDHEEAHPASSTKDSKDHKDEATTPTKPRTARAAEKDEKHEDSHGQAHPASSTKDSEDHKKEASTSGARPARATEEEIKGAVHDQPIPIPPTLKEENKNQDTKHTEEKKETPKSKREADEKEKDETSSEENSEDKHPSESPLSYAKTLSGQKGDEHFALPHLDSEYDRHVRQTNNDHHPLLLHKELPAHSHGIQTSRHNDDSSSSSSSEENKSKSS